MASKSSGRLVLSISRAPLASFLYETPTLRPISHPLRRPFVCQTRRQQSTLNALGHQEEGQDHSSGESNTRDNENGTLQVESQPAGKATGTPRRSFLRKRGAAVSARVAEQAAAEAPPIDFASITRSEKKAFVNLISGFERSQKEQEQSPAETPTQSKAGSELSSLLSIFDSILGEGAVQPPAAPAPAVEKKDGPQQRQRSKDPETTEDDLRELRDAPTVPLSALGFPDARNTTVTIPDGIKRVVRREMRAIEDALFDAINEGKGDMGLWDICKDRIFSMLQCLDVSGHTVPSASRNTSPSPASLALFSSKSIEIPSVLPATTVVGELYPKTLLLAFRLLSSHFPESSLIDQFRSVIKSQSRTSAFLSTSESLTTEMMAFYWHKNQDLPTVVSLLRDINNSGIQVNDELCQLLSDIITDQKDHTTRVKWFGESGRSVWDLPPTQKALSELVQKGGWLDRLDLRRKVPA